jgi:hypothetical protein
MDEINADEKLALQLLGTRYESVNQSQLVQVKVQQLK